MARQKTRNGRAYVSPRTLPEMLLREKANITREMGEDFAEAEINRVRLTRRYQNAIKSKFELEYIDTSGGIKRENTFVYSIYRMARSSLLAADKEKGINLLVEQERRAGRELEAAEKVFVGKARAFIAEVLESAAVREKDAKLFYMVNPSARPEQVPVDTDARLRREAPEKENPEKRGKLVYMSWPDFVNYFTYEPEDPRRPVLVRVSEMPPRASHEEPVVAWPVQGNLGTIQRRWYANFLRGAAVAASILFFSTRTGSEPINTGVDRIQPVQIQAEAVQP